MEFNQKQLQFITDVVEKELFFAEPNEPTTFTRIIAAFVQSERDKVADGDIGSDNPEEDIQTADEILSIMAQSLIGE